jgi:hypothetical protein
MKKVDYIHPSSKLSFLYLIPKEERLSKKKTALYKCTCGTEKIIMISEVKNGKTISCGCFRKSNMQKRLTTHGLTKHPLFAVWSGILNRCYNTNVHNYKDYGGRGVVVCDEWKKDFKAFFNWCTENGWQKGMQIDKDIKSSVLGIMPKYSPETCTIVTNTENMNKTRRNVLLTLNGETKNVTQWSVSLGLNRGTIYDRIDLGWEDEKILLYPKRQYPI